MGYYRGSAEKRWTRSAMPETLGQDQLIAWWWFIFASRTSASVWQTKSTSKSKKPCCAYLLFYTCKKQNKKLKQKYKECYRLLLFFFFFKLEVGRKLIMASQISQTLERVHLWKKQKVSTKLCVAKLSAVSAPTGNQNNKTAGWLAKQWVETLKYHKN